jgi:hypothetical protein
LYPSRSGRSSSSSRDTQSRLGQVPILHKETKPICPAAVGVKPILKGWMELNRAFGGGIMIYRGHVKDGTIVLDEDVSLPDGTPVTIQPVEPADMAQQSEIPTLYERFHNVIGKATDLPTDFADQHDHYIHGTPKQ